MCLYPIFHFMSTSKYVLVNMSDHLFFDEVDRWLNKTDHFYEVCMRSNPYSLICKMCDAVAENADSSEWWVGIAAPVICSSRTVLPFVAILSHERVQSNVAGH